MTELHEYDTEDNLEQDDKDLLSEFFDYDGSTYICDAISEIADSNISIWNKDILDNASNLYFDGAYEEAAQEGFMGEGTDLIRNLQSAWYVYNQRQLYNNLDALIYNYAVNMLNENKQFYSETQLETLEEKLENIDNNSCFYEIEEAVSKFIEEWTPDISEYTSDFSIFEKFTTLFPYLVNGDTDYVKMEPETFMKLAAEKVDDNIYSLAHYYEQNGDLMRDPEIVIWLDKENKTVKLLSFQQDNLGIYREFGESNDEQSDVLSFMSGWLDNICDMYFREPNEMNLEENDEMEI